MTPASPHRITTWGLAGRTHRTCSCSPTVDPAAADCVDYALARRLLADAWTLATARADVKPRSWPKPEHPGPLTAAAQRQRGDLLLRLVLAAAGDTPAELETSDVSSSWGAGQELTPEPRPEPVGDQGGQEDEPEARAVSGVAVDVTGLLGAGETDAAPALTGHTCIVWVRSDYCPHCKRRHAARGDNRPPLCFDPTYEPPAYCTVCTWPVDPVAAAEFAGRHAMCSLPTAERLRWESDVREHGRRRRGQHTREETAA